MTRLNLILLALAVAIAAVPLMVPMGDWLFLGSDDLAMTAISSNAPDYRPWMRPLWKPPSGEVEGLLFALQAALGAGVIGYYLGYRQGRRRLKEDACAGH